MDPAAQPATEAHMEDNAFQADEPENTGKHWYAVHTRSRHEKKIASVLEETGVDHFLPVYETLSRRKDRKQTIALPLFAGYLFVKIVPERERILEVLKVPGVVRIIGKTPTELFPIPESQIESVRRMVESDRLISGHPYIKEGSRVRVKVGPLQGVEGILQERRGRHKLIISVDMLQQAVATEISVDEIEPV